MTYRPFLSHAHARARDLDKLHDELRLRGAGGWKDADDLRLGRRWKPAFRHAIGRQTGGFILWATPEILESETIRDTEIPAALRRTRQRWRRPYPVVPMFVGLDPGRDEGRLQEKLGQSTADQLSGLQGVVRRKRESVADFAARAATVYVRDIVREHKRPTLRVAVTGGRTPTGRHDLSLDWRHVLDGRGCASDATVLPTLIGALATIREAALERRRHPKFVVDAHVRLPLGALIGWEFNRGRQIELEVIQATRHRSFRVPDLPVASDCWPRPAAISHQGDGPALLAVSVGKDFGVTVGNYADANNICESMHLHVPSEALSAQEICALASWTAGRLAELNSRGLARHLLLIGPVSLAIRIGAAAHGTGETFVPFWDGGTGYSGGVTIGVDPR